MRTRRRTLPGPTLGFVKVFANVISYGLAAGAALCLTVALCKSFTAKRATSTRKTRMKRG